MIDTPCHTVQQHMIVESTRQQGVSFLYFDVEGTLSCLLMLHF